MTTATKQKTTATDRHAELAAVHDQAKAELNAVKQRAHEYRGKIHALRERLLGRTIDHSAEFTATGQPKPDTEASKLASEITKHAEGDNFDALVHGAEQRLERARLELRRHGEQQARTLLVELLPECEAAVAEFVKWAGEGSTHLQRLAELQHRASSICHETRAYDVRDVPNLDHWSNAVRGLATGAPPLPLPRALLAELKAAEDE